MEINENGKLFETNFGELGLQVRFVKGVDSPLGKTYFYDLVYISQFNRNYLKSLIEKIAVYHHLDISLVDTKESHFAIFVKSKQSTLSLSAILNQREMNIGKDINGKLVALDFKKAPHLLIGGATGSGKSVLIRNILVNLLNYYGNRLQLVLIDPKGTELYAYRNCRNTTFVSETMKAISVLQQCEKIMDDRYKNGGYYHHEIFIVIDELADLMLTSHYEVEQSIVRIAQKGRACGIHLIVATQDPRVQVVSGLIKANMPYRIALKMASYRNSVIILDHKGAESLQGNGDCIAKLGLNETRTQIAFVDNYLENQIINQHKG